MSKNYYLKINTLLITLLLLIIVSSGICNVEIIIEDVILYNNAGEAIDQDLYKGGYSKLADDSLDVESNELRSNSIQGELTEMVRSRPTIQVPMKKLMPTDKSVYYSHTKVCSCKSCNVCNCPTKYCCSQKVANFLGYNRAGSIEVKFKCNSNDASIFTTRASFEDEFLFISCPVTSAPAYVSAPNISNYLWEHPVITTITAGSIAIGFKIFYDWCFP